MFNLVGKRYLFIIISLVIIIPGTISLIVKGLNVGIDFAGGTTISFRPQAQISATTVKSALQPLKLSDLTVIPGTNDSLPGNQTIWIRLNTSVDSTVQSYIQNALRTKFNSQALVVNFSDITLENPVTVVTVTKFPQGVTPKVSDVEDALKSIPNTTDTTKATATPTTGTATPGATTTPTTAATVTPTTAATVTPTTVATATPTTAATATATTVAGTATPAVTPTATATPTTNSAATIAVKWVDVQQGKTTQTINLLIGQGSVIATANLWKIQSAIYNKTGVYTQLVQQASVSASVASETTRNAILAVITASALILLYVWFSFRKISKAWRYGACAIIALLHDVLVVLGVFSILGWTLNKQVDALFITALLTVVGFSVHDTIVVFDRIRENMQRRTSESFEQVVNASLVQTMARSLNTSLTVLFTLSALTIFGSGSVQNFTLALFGWFFSGTYSSIFNASMLLVIWEKGELGLNRLSRRSGTSDSRKARELVGSR